MSKRIISVCLACLLLISFPCSALQEQQEIGSELLLFSDLARTVATVFPLIAPTESNTEIYVGNRVAGFIMSETGMRESDYDSYPIFYSNTLIGFADVIDTENGPAINCWVIPENTLNYSSGISLIYAQDNCYIKTSSDLLLAKGVSSPVEASVVKKMQISLSPVGKRHIGAAPVEKSSQASTDFYLNVPFVANASAACCPPGLCWAASTAMIKNYYHATQHTAASIHAQSGCFASAYDILKEDGIENPNAYDVEIYILNLFGINTSGATSSSYFTYNNIRSNIDADRLMYLHVENPTYSIAHIIVAHGYYSNGSTTGFYYTDPNNAAGAVSFYVLPAVAGNVMIPLQVGNTGYACSLYAYIVAYD